MAPLTKAQWAAGPKKSGTYAAYVKWYNRYVALPKDPLAPWSQRQLSAEAARQVSNTFNTQKKQLETEQANNAATIRASSEAASKLIAANAPQVSAAYSQATQDLGGIGAHYSDAMKARIQGAQDAAAQFASSQGEAPTAPAVDAQALADSSYHGGVAIPAASLASEGAANSALMTQEAGVPLLQEGQDLRANQQDYEKQLLQLAEQRPELTDKITQQLFQNEMAKFEARIKQQAQNAVSAQFENTVRHQKVTEAQGAQRNRIAQNRYDLQVKAHQDAMDRAALQDHYPDASKSRAYGYIVDETGHPILDKNGKKIPVKLGTTAKDKATKAAAQYQKAVGEAAKMWKQKNPGVDEFGTKKVPVRNWQWGNALRYLMNRYGINRAKARKALIAAGFPPPGKKAPSPEDVGPPYGGGPVP